MPAVLLWEDLLEESVIVPLKELDHRQIFEVIQVVVQAIRDDCDLKDVAKQGTVQVWNSQQNDVMPRNSVPLVINNRGVMGDIYNNVGITGTMGPNSVAHDNVFLQEARNALSDVSLIKEDACIVEELAKLLISQQIEGLDWITKIEGANHLAVIAEATIKSQDLNGPLAEWKKWLSNLGGKANVVLSILANAATIASPIAKLLGIHF